MNKVILMGRLAADPDYRQTPQGTPVCRIRVAVQRNYVSKETGRREADFIEVEAWRGTADLVARYFKKGKPIIVEGSLATDNYTDQNGVKHYRTLVKASSVSFCLTDSSANGNNGGDSFGYNSYNNSYQQPVSYGNNYQGSYAPQGGNNGYYQQQPPAPPVYQQPINNASAIPNDVSAQNQDDDILQTANLEDFEEILSDGEVPF